MVVEHGPRSDVDNDIEVAETHVERVQEEQKNVKMVCSVQFRSWRLTGQDGHLRPNLVGHSEIMLGHLVDAYTQLKCTPVEIDDVLCVVSTLYTTVAY